MAYTASESAIVQFKSARSGGTMSDPPPHWSAPWLPAALLHPRIVYRDIYIDAAARLQMARNYYEMAIRDVFGKSVRIKLTSNSHHDEWIWRLEIHVGPEIYSDLSRLLSGEDAVHQRVYQISPDSMGFFSLQFHGDA